MGQKGGNMKVSFTIMKRDHKTGESKPYDVIVASTPAKAKSNFHLKTDTYDSGLFSYWAKYPVCR
jgi:hypothetical protein